MSLLTQIASVLRDYVVQGVPASGAHEPVKSEIRGLLADIIATIANGGETLTVELAADIAAIAADLENIDVTVANAIADALVDAVAEATAAADASAITAQAAAATAPMVYSTTAAGLAAVAEGETFWVAGASGLGLYRDVAGVATLIDSLPLSSTVLAKRSFGEVATQSIDTNLGGSPVPADIGQIYIGNTVASADAITIDANVFPPGIALRRYQGTPGSPTAATASDLQLGYVDFRALFEGEFYNAASLDVVINGALVTTTGCPPPTKMRLSVSDGLEVSTPVEVKSSGVEVGAIDGEDYYGPGTLGDCRLFANVLNNDYAAIFAARPVSGVGSGVRIYTTGETSGDNLIVGSAGANVTKFLVQSNGDVTAAGVYKVGANQVVGAQGAAVANATDAASAITQLNALLARMRAHGLIAT